MATNFPTSLDSFTNPTASDPTNSVTVPHATQHANANDAIEALQAKVGVNSSAVATSLDYKVTDITSRVVVLEAGGQTVSTPTIVSNAYAIVAGNAGKLLLLDNGATPMTLNVNTGLGLTAGARIDIAQTGTGQVTVAGSATVNATPGKKLRAQYSGATLVCTASNTFLLVGDLSA